MTQDISTAYDHLEHLITYDEESFRDMFESMQTQYERHGHLSVKQANLVFWRLKKIRRDFSPKDFNIIIDRTSPEIIGALKEYQINALLPALSDEDRGWVNLAYKWRNDPRRFAFEYAKWKGD